MSVKAKLDQTYIIINVYFLFSDVVDNVIQLSRQKIKKLGRSRRAIPRFVKRQFFEKLETIF